MKSGVNRLKELHSANQVDIEIFIAFNVSSSVTLHFTSETIQYNRHNLCIYSSSSFNRSSTICTKRSYISRNICSSRSRCATRALHLLPSFSSCFQRNSSSDLMVWSKASLASVSNKMETQLLVPTGSEYYKIANPLRSLEVLKLGGSKHYKILLKSRHEILQTFKSLYIEVEFGTIRVIRNQFTDKIL
uniref:Uncharacterized protein n=1 Tax=Glossina pallidipes TaxID=7398 RepID=A0A1B0A792_GLOPL